MSAAGKREEAVKAVSSRALGSGAPCSTPSRRPEGAPRAAAPRAAQRWAEPVAERPNGAQSAPARSSTQSAAAAHRRIQTRRDSTAACRYQCRLRSDQSRQDRLKDPTYSMTCRCRDTAESRRIAEREPPAATTGGAQCSTRQRDAVSIGQGRPRARPRPRRVPTAPRRLRALLGGVGGRGRVPELHRMGMAKELGVGRPTVYQAVCNAAAIPMRCSGACNLVTTRERAPLLLGKRQGSHQDRWQAPSSR